MSCLISTSLVIGGGGEFNFEEVVIYQTFDRTMLHVRNIVFV